MISISIYRRPVVAAAYLALFEASGFASEAAGRPIPEDLARLEIIATELAPERFRATNVERALNRPPGNGPQCLAIFRI
jgi:hypothetical protein